MASADEKFAFKLQLEEILAISLNDSPKRPPSVGAAAGKRLSTLRSKEEVVELFERWAGIRREGEAGEASLMAENGEEFFCNICFESKPLGELFIVKSCPHCFCSDCISRYVAVKVEENIVSIPCPSCKDGILEPEDCREILPKDVFERWGLALCEYAIGTGKLYCPFKDCSGMLIDDGGSGAELLSNVECPHCRRMFCARCKVPWHAEIDCEAFQKLGDNERGQDDLALRKIALDCQWQRCPQCKFYVEKADGCVFIKCRCGHRFCYLCASPMTEYSHHCKKCKRTW